MWLVDNIDAKHIYLSINQIITYFLTSWASGLKDNLHRISPPRNTMAMVFGDSVTRSISCHYTSRNRSQEAKSEATTGGDASVGLAWKLKRRSTKKETLVNGNCIKQANHSLSTVSLMWILERTDTELATKSHQATTAAGEAAVALGVVAVNSGMHTVSDLVVYLSSVY